MKKLSILFIILFLAFACKQEEISIERVELQPKFWMDQFCDTTFFSDIKFMYAYRDLLYVSDFTRNQVMVLNDGVLVATISSIGQGPGELIGASSLVVRNDTIYVHDAVRRHLTVFYKNNYLRDIKIPVGSSGLTNFGLSGNRAIVTDFQPPHSLAFVDLYTGEVTNFGQMFEFGSPVKNKHRNHRHIHVQNPFIYAISKNQPIIERYDLQGNLVDIYDYSNIEEVTQRLAFIKQQPDEERSVFSLVEKSYLRDNKLYLLLITVDDNDRPQSNKILEIDVSRTMRATRILELKKGGWIRSFCVLSDAIWVFQPRNTVLIKYELP